MIQNKDESSTVRGGVSGEHREVQWIPDARQRYQSVKNIKGALRVGLSSQNVGIAVPIPQEITPVFKIQGTATE